MAINMNAMPKEIAGKTEAVFSVYPDEYKKEDIIDNYFEQVHDEFGMRALRGTAIAFHNADSNLLYSTESLFRKFIEGKEIDHAVEIGTWRGVSTALLAHYAKRVTTIDIVYYPEALPVWMYFGVHDKIKYAIVEDNIAKKQVLDEMEFDFAFIDGDHSAEGVALDFELVKKCGRVLFHDYGMKHTQGITNFVNCMPKEELIISQPFAYWEKNG